MDYTEKDLIEKLKNHGYKQFGSALFANNELLLEGSTLKDLLCEIVGVGYRTDTNEVLNLLKERLYEVYGK